MKDDAKNLINIEKKEAATPIQVGSDISEKIKKDPMLKENLLILSRAMELSKLYELYKKEPEKYALALAMADMSVYGC